VAIGGGTGLPIVLAGLRRALWSNATQQELTAVKDWLTAIVTVTDDGGSSGWLRRELGILPPGDIRNCLASLAPDHSPFRELLHHRFGAPNDLAAHPVGNLLLAALTQISGDFPTAVSALASMMELQGSVLPSTAENVMLNAEFQNGERRRGETAIVTHGRRIKQLSLERSVRPLPEAIRALINADVIVVGPGSLYTSIIPNLLVDGIASTMTGVRAVRIYVANLMTEPGATDGFSLADHIDVIRAHTGFDLFDYVLVNRNPVERSAVAKYARRGAIPVQRSPGGVAGCGATIVERELPWQVERGKIRHDPAALGEAILELAALGRPAIARMPQSTVCGSVNAEAVTETAL